MCLTLRSTSPLKNSRQLIDDIIKLYDNAKMNTAESLKEHASVGQRIRLRIWDTAKCPDLQPRCVQPAAPLRTLCVAVTQNFFIFRIYPKSEKKSSYYF